MKRFTQICGLSCLLMVFAVSCATRHAAVTQLQIRGAVISRGIKVGGVAALVPKKRCDAALPRIVRIQATGDVVEDPGKGICLLITLKVFLQ